MDMSEFKSLLDKEQQERYLDLLEKAMDAEWP
jgi:hypothetical protein